MSQKWKADAVREHLEIPMWSSLRRLLWLTSTLMIDTVRDMLESSGAQSLTPSQATFLR